MTETIFPFFLFFLLFLKDGSDYLKQSLARCIKMKYICGKKEEVMFANFNFQQMVSAFIVLFAVIDIIGSIPIIINLKEKEKM